MLRLISSISVFRKSIWMTKGSKKLVFFRLTPIVYFLFLVWWQKEHPQTSEGLTNMLQFVCITAKIKDEEMTYGDTIQFPPSKTEHITVSQVTVACFIRHFAGWPTLDTVSSSEIHVLLTIAIGNIYFMVYRQTGTRWENLKTISGEKRDRNWAVKQQKVKRKMTCQTCFPLKTAMP